MRLDLITRNSQINISDCHFQILEGGVLRVERPDGKADHLSPAYWAAVVTDGSSLDHQDLCSQDVVRILDDA